MKGQREREVQVFLPSLPAQGTPQAVAASPQTPARTALSRAAGSRYPWTGTLGCSHPASLPSGLGVVAASCLIFQVFHHL